MQFIVLLQIHLLLLSFFGTGNIASVNSFDPTAVFCFLSVFRPFIMAIFVLLKIFHFYLCSFLYINYCLQFNSFSNFILVFLINYCQILIPCILVSCAFYMIFTWNQRNRKFGISHFTVLSLLVSDLMTLVSILFSVQSFCFLLK